MSPFEITIKQDFLPFYIKEYYLSSNKRLDKKFILYKKVFKKYPKFDIIVFSSPRKALAPL